MNTSEVREIILRVNGEDAQQKIRGNAKIQSLIGNLSRLKVLPTAISFFSYYLTAYLASVCFFYNAE